MFRILLLSVVLCSISSALNVKYGSPLIFSFPCNDNPRYLTQEFQVSDNNRSVSWKGVVYLDKDWLNSDNVKLDIVFDHAATVEVNRRQVHLIDLDGSEKKRFRLTTVQAPRVIHRIDFNVSGVEDGQIPSVLSITANELVLCDNKGRNPNVDLIQKQSVNGPVLSEVEEAHTNRCGVRHPILAEDWPWKISLYAKEPDTADNEWSLVCGGTLIGTNRVLTAGSCVKNRNAETLMVEIGNENVTVKDLHVHDEYQAESLKDDVAVLLIRKPTTEKRYPICLYSGWGRSEDKNVTLGVLNRAKDQEFEDLKIEESILCLESNRKDFAKYLSSKQLCTKSESSSDVRFLPGDGLYEEFFDEDRLMFGWKIKGIGSVTKTPHYALFTDVSKYLTFILNYLIDKN